MKISDGLILRDVAGSHVVVNVGKTLDFNGMITLNETGAFIWKLIENGDGFDAIVDAVCDKYGIDHSTAEADTKKYIDKMKEAKLIVE